MLAIEASTGRVYEPRLDDILDGHKGKQCSFRVEDAGFANRTNVEILVRVKLRTALDVDETEDDVPPRSGARMLKRLGTSITAQRMK